MSSKINYKTKTTKHLREKFPDGHLEDCSLKSRKRNKEISFKPVSVILSTSSNFVLNKDNNYIIRFSTGIVEGSGVSVSNDGSEILFENTGSYRFEICGDATPFSDVSVCLSFHCECFTDEVKHFSQIDVPNINNKLLLRGLATILPIKRNNTISTKLIANPDDSILLMAKTRLLIHRVA